MLDKINDDRGKTDLLIDAISMQMMKTDSDA
jgi:hypothetical protein